MNIRLFRYANEIRSSVLYFTRKLQCIFKETIFNSTKVLELLENKLVTISR